MLDYQRIRRLFTFHFHSLQDVVGVVVRFRLEWKCSERTLQKKMSESTFFLLWQDICHWFFFYNVLSEHVHSSLNLTTTPHYVLVATPYEVRHLHRVEESITYCVTYCVTDEGRGRLGLWQSRRDWRSLSDLPSLHRSEVREVKVKVKVKVRPIRFFDLPETWHTCISQ